MDYLDLTKSTQKIIQGPKNWYGKSINDDTIDFMSHYIQINGKPVFLLAGEIHPTRTDENFWEESILKMKAGGLNTISFYIIWNHIEKRPGEFDFRENRNIRKFVELCKKHDMYVWPRVGPFVNSEALHGGLPSWLYGMPLKERSNDSNYMFYVEKYYKEIGKQLDGLLFKDGGPVIAIQIENEYGHAPASWDTFYFYGAGPVSIGEDGESHMLKLKEIAIKCGLVVPVYSCTGWGSPIPKDEFLPVYGCYAYLGDSGPTDTSTFSFKQDGNNYPAAFAELGGGAPTQREWRPVIPAESAEAGIFTRVACGGNITGLFVYHGGTNPASYDRFNVMYDGMTLVSYDWNSPISEFGFLRDSYYQLKPLQQFLADFQDLFCKMVPVWQEKYVEPDNTEDLRYMARVNGESGFIFINNFQDKLQLPERNDIKIALDFEKEKIVLFENEGISVNSGVMAIFPFNLRIGSTLLKYSSTQPLCRIENDGIIYWFFFVHEGTKPEYVFDQNTIINVKEGITETTDGKMYIKPNHIGFDSEFKIETSTGNISIITLTHAQAKRCTKAVVNGMEVLFHSDCDLINDGRTVRVSCIGKNELSFSVFPHENGRISGPTGIIEGKRQGRFFYFETSFDKIFADVNIKKYGRDKITVKVSKEYLQGLNDIFLKISYSGDIARVFNEGMMVTDHINDGLPWYLGLKRLLKLNAEKGIFIKLEPKRDGFSRIVFDGITFHMTGQRVGDEPYFLSCEILPEYCAHFSI